MDLVTLLQVLWLREKVKETPVSTAEDRKEIAKPDQHPCANMTPGSPAYLSCVMEFGRP